MALHENSFYIVTAGTRFRYESFGGIIYQRAADQLHFVNSRLAVTLLEMAGSGSVRDIAEKLSKKQAQGVNLERILAILHRWERLGIISSTINTGA